MTLTLEQKAHAFSQLGIPWTRTGATAGDPDSGSLEVHLEQTDLLTEPTEAELEQAYLAWAARPRRATLAERFEALLSAIEESSVPLTRSDIEDKALALADSNKRPGKPARLR